MRKGAAIPEQTCEIQHALAAVAVPCLVHAQHTVHALDCAARSYGVGQDVPDSCVRLGPIWGQTLAQELLHDDQLRRGCLARAVRTRQVSTPRPQANHGLTSERVRYGLGKLGVHPVQVVQGPRIVQPTPHFAPGLAPQCFQGCGELRLRPGPVIALPVGPHAGQGRPEGFHRRVPLYGLVKGALRFAPRGPRASGGPPRLDAPLFGMRDLLIRLRRRVQELFRLRPPSADDPLHRALGVQHLQADLDGLNRGLARLRGGSACLVGPVRTSVSPAEN